MSRLLRRFAAVSFLVLAVGGCSVFEPDSSKSKSTATEDQAVQAAYPSIRENYGARALPDAGWKSDVGASIKIPANQP